MKDSYGTYDGRKPEPAFTDDRDAEIARLRELLRGFLWLLDRGALVRDTSRDGEPDYPMRSLRLTMFLSRAAGVALPEDGE